MFLSDYLETFTKEMVYIINGVEYRHIALIPFQLMNKTISKAKIEKNMVYITIIY